MKNSTILFGFIILVTLLSMISDKTIEIPKRKMCFEEKGNSSKQLIEQLPIISIKKD